MSLKKYLKKYIGSRSVFLKTKFGSIYYDLHRLRKLFIWLKKERCTSPSPHFVKQSVLLRHAVDNATWIETGTYLGSTTAILSERFPIVHTIEPSNECLQIARQNLKAFKNIIFHNRTSEECLESICKSLTGDICFWLDGHYSAGITFQGDKETPIIYELETISKYISQFNNVVILIDDIRCSHIDKENYPSIDFYVDWAKSNNMLWNIEQDIFIIKNTKFIY